MSFRNEFPILEKSTYLASHSLGAVPRATRESLDRYYQEWATLGILAWDGPWWSMLSEFGNEVARSIGAPADSVVPMENVTRGFAAVASSIDWEKARATGRNRILLTSLEFITSYPFWQGWAKSVGAEIVQIDSEDGISIPVDRILDRIDDRTLLVPTSHVYFRSGAIQDLRAISKKAHHHGAWVLGDGYQAAGIIPVEVEAMEIDFYVGGSHKWLCGGPGAGFLYVRPDLTAHLRPSLSGWFGIANPFEYDPTTHFQPAKGTQRFLAGTPSIPALYAAIEGVRLNNRVGIKTIRESSLLATRFLIEEALSRNLKVKTPRANEERAGMICIDFDRAKEATESLIRDGVVVDYRPNCGIRVSPHYYNSREDLVRFWSVLDSWFRSN